MLLPEEGHPLCFEGYQTLLRAVPLEVRQALRQQGKTRLSQNFYEEKEKLANVINFVKNKINKITEKVTTKTQEVEDVRKVKRDEKIKEKAFDNKIIQEEKKLRQIEEELRKVVAEKLQRMQEEERRRQREEEEREKARIAEEERERAEKEERLRE